MSDEISRLAEVVVELLRETVAEAEDETLPEDSRLDAARSVDEVMTRVLSTPVMRERIDGGLRTRMERVAWMAKSRRAG
jgi:hypothetical protein